MAPLALANGVALVIEEQLRVAAEKAVDAIVDEKVKEAIEEERIDQQVEKAVEEHMDNVDFDDDIKDAVEKFDFDTVIETAVKDSGLDGLIADAVREKVDELMGSLDFLVSLANLVAARLALRNVRRPLLQRVWRQIRVRVRLARRRGR